MRVLVTGGAGFIGSHVAEAAVEAGHRVLVVDDLSTGRTENVPRDADFHPVDIRNREAFQDAWKKEKINQIALLLKGALKAEGMVGLKLNVPQDRLDTVIGLLPSLTAPTVSNLYQQDWCSVETIIAESTVREIVPKLQKEGAEGIIEYSLNKII